MNLALARPVKLRMVRSAIRSHPASVGIRRVSGTGQGFARLAMRGFHEEVNQPRAGWELQSGSCALSQKSREGLKPTSRVEFAHDSVLQHGDLGVGRVEA